MVELRKNFKGQLDNEVVQCYFRRHWIKIIPAILVIPFCWAAYILTFFYWPIVLQSGSFMAAFALLGLILVTAIMHYEFLNVFHYFLNTVIITNSRIVLVDKSVFFRDSRTAIDLTKIQDVQKRQNGLFPYVLKYATLVVSLSSGDPITIDFTPQPDFQFKKINEVKKMYSEREQGGLTSLPNTLASPSNVLTSNQMVNPNFISMPPPLPAQENSPHEHAVHFASINIPFLL